MTNHFRTPAAASMATTEWSMEFDFEEIEIEEDGIHFGSFSGSAELGINDPRDRDFYVKTVVLTGTKYQRQSIGGYGLTIPKRIASVILLRKPASDDRTFTAHLFRKLEAALYANRDAQERFQRELESDL